jgi:hypothetical protein
MYRLSQEEQSRAISLNPQALTHLIENYVPEEQLRRSEG